MEAAVKDAERRLRAKRFESDFNYYKTRFPRDFDLDLDADDYVLLKMQVLCPYEYCEAGLAKAAHVSVGQTTTLELSEPLDYAFEEEVLPSFESDQEITEDPSLGPYFHYYETSVAHDLDSDFDEDDFVLLEMQLRYDDRKNNIDKCVSYESNEDGLAEAAHVNVVLEADEDPMRVSEPLSVAEEMEILPGFEMVEEISEIEY